MYLKVTPKLEKDIVNDYLEPKALICQIAQKYNLNPATVSRVLKRNSIKINNPSILSRKYTLDEGYFDKIDTEDKAYFLGLLYADGYNHEPSGCVSIALQERDQDILTKFSLYLKSNKPLRTYVKDIDGTHNSWQNAIRLCINSKHMSKRLIELGCFYKKTFTIKFPTEEQVPAYLIQHFVRGMWDGDGYIGFGKAFNKARQNYYNTYQCSLTSTSDICNAVKELIKDLLDLNSCIECRFPERNNNTRSVRLGGRLCVWKFLDWLYQSATVYLDRKYLKYLEMKNTYSKKDSRCISRID